ncbi:MAG: TolC family protein [Bacteroidota bacterium]|nr:TolC family protein [Bacteroidota bacterium]
MNEQNMSKYIKRKLPKLLILLLLISSGIKAQNGSNYTFSLKDAIEYTYKNLSSVQNSELDKLSAQARVSEIYGLGLPQVTGSLDFNNYLSIPTSLLPGEFFGAPAGTFIPVKFGTKYNATAGFGASQLLFNNDFLIGLKASRTFIGLTQKNIERTRLEAATNVAKAYYSVVINKKRIQLIDANIVRLQKTYNDLNAVYKQGLAEQIDVDRLSVSLTNLQVERDKVQAFIELSTQLLKFQMGMPIADQLALSDTLRADVVKTLETQAVSYANRPEYSLLEYQLQLNELSAKRIRGQYLPTLVAVGALNANAQRTEFNFFNTDEKWFAISLIGLRMNWSLFDGFQRKYQLRQANYTIQKNQNDLVNTKNYIDFQLSQANISYSNNYKTLQNVQRNLDLAQRVVSVAQKKFSAGVGTNLEVVNAEADLIEAQTNYYSSLYEIIISQIDYKRALGSTDF